MSHNPLTAIIDENKRYFTFFNVSIALILITGAEIAIIEMPTGWVFNLAVLVIRIGKCRDLRALSALVIRVVKLHQFPIVLVPYETVHIPASMHVHTAAMHLHLVGCTHPSPT